MSLHTFEKKVTKQKKLIQKVNRAPKVVVSLAESGFFKGDVSSFERVSHFKKNDCTVQVAGRSTQKSNLGITIAHGGLG